MQPGTEKKLAVPTVSVGAIEDESASEQNIDSNEELLYKDAAPVKSNTDTLEPESVEKGEKSKGSMEHSSDENSSSRKSRSKSRVKPKPLKFAHFIIHRPCWIIWICLIVLVLMTIIDGYGFELISNTPHGYYINSDKRVHRRDAVVLAGEYLSDQSDAVAIPKTQEIDEFLLMVMFRKNNGGNIINSDDINKIVATENLIREKNPEKYYALCAAHTDTAPNCSDSAISSPFQDVSDGEGSEVSDADIDQLIADSHGNVAYLSSFQEGFQDTNESTFYRSFWRFGLPYPNKNATHSTFRDKNHKEEKQFKKYDDYIYDIYIELQTDTNIDGLEIIINGWRVIDIQFGVLINSGMGWAFGSIVAVWILMCVHLGTAYLATISMLQIIFGFPFAYFIYRFLFQVTYFDTISTMIIFVILGIGADDVFVFSDAWTQSEVFVENPEDLVERMSFAFRRASKAMLVTQITTFFAFLATVFSPLMPIAAFGIWASMVVMCNYILVITFFPANLSFWYQYLRPCEKKCSAFCCGWCPCCKKSSTVEDDENPEIEMPAKTGDTPPKSDTEDPRTDGEDSAAEVTFEEEMQKGRAIERFLGTVWADNIIKYRYYILAFFGCWFIVSVSFAAQMTGLTETEAWFSREHYISKAFDWPEKFYGGAVNDLLTLWVAWGPKDRVDRSDVGAWDGEYYGEVQWDNKFDLSPVEAQQHIYDVCETIRTEYHDDLYDAEDPDYYSCFMYDLIDYANYSTNGTLTFPFVFSNDPEEQKAEFTNLVANWTTNDPVGNFYLVSREVGYIESEHILRFVVLTLSLDEDWSSPVDRRAKLSRKWQNRMEDFNDLAKENGADSVSKGFQASEAWAWVASSYAFVTSAVQGVAIALPIACVVLVISTHNWIVALMATSTIVGILAVEVSLMQMQGWQLGVGESIAVVIMIGFSVDYVVHLGNAYVECEFSDQRLDRIRFALYTMGISVLMGACTTFGSGIFLFFPEFRFFWKFGVLITSTVAFSLLYAMTYFIALLAVAGPSGKKGYVPVSEWSRKYVIDPISHVCCGRGGQNDVTKDDDIR